MRNKDISKLVVSLGLLGMILGGCGNASNPSTLQESNSTLNESSSNTLQTNANAQDDTLSAFTTHASANDVVSSQETLFIAEGDEGIEILHIGYSDRIEHELITTIDGINAKNVSLSTDQKKLYVENKEGYINTFDISDIQAPKEDKRIIQKESFDNYPTSDDGIYQYIPQQEEGLAVYNISNPSNTVLVSQFLQSQVYDFVLVEDGTKALIATKTNGIALLDLGNLTDIQVINTYPIEGNTLGLSINEDSGLLFVANGDKGIKVYDLTLFLYDLQN